MFLDNDVGFPHWGYPVCSKCGATNKDYKYLYRLGPHIDAGSITVEDAVLVRATPTPLDRGRE